VRGALAIGAFAVFLTACASGAVGADTPTVLLDRAGPNGVWELTGQRRGGRLCATLRAGEDVIGERCGSEMTDTRTWEVTTVAYGERVIAFAPLPSAALHVRIDGVDDSLHVVDARTAAGYPGRFFLDDVDSRASPQVVRVFAAHGRALVPSG
jgi:hypothetical protein